MKERARVLLAASALAVAFVLPATAHGAAYFTSVAVPHDALSLAGPADVVSTLDGKTFVVDAGGGRVLASDAGGGLTAVLDGEDAPGEELLQPVSVDVGDDGLLYVADVAADRVSVFEPNGTFVRSWTGAAGAGGRLDGPAGIDVDGGLVYVSDSFRNRIQVFTTAGAYVRTFGVTEGVQGSLSLPTAVRVYAGELYVADVNNTRIQVFGTGGGWRRTWGVTDGGAGGQTTSRYQVITGIDVLPGGRVFVTGISALRGVIQAGTPVIEECTISGALVGTWGGAPPLAAPRGVSATSDGNLVFADAQLNNVVRFDVAARTFSTPWTLSGDVQPGRMRSPGGIALASDGSFYVADTANARLQSLSRTGVLQSVIGTAGAGALSEPQGLDVSDDDLEIFVADTGLDAVVVLAPSGDHLRTLGAGVLTDPTAVCAVGNVVYVADTGADRIVKLNGVTDALLGIYGMGELAFPGGVAVDGSGRVYVSDSSNNRIVSFDSTSSPAAVLAGGGSGVGEFLEPGELALDASGDLVVADRGNNRVQRITTAGAPVVAFGESGAGLGELRSPAAVDANGLGLVAVADTANHRAQVFGYDDLPPISSDNVPPGWSNAPVSVTLTATDYESGMGYVRYRVGSAAETTYTGPFTIADQGETLLRYRATDRSGNTEFEHLTTVRIDSLPPTGAVVWAGGASVIGTTTLTLHAALADAQTMRTRVNGPWSVEQPYIADKTFTLPGEGRYPVTAEYRDWLGNTRTDAATVTVDKTPPSVSFTGLPASGATSTSVLAGVQATDATAGVSAVYLSVDGGPEQLYAGAVTIPAEGTHTVRARAIDGVGNASAVVTRTFAIDRTPPAGTIAPQGGNYFVQDPVFVLIPAVAGADEMRFEPGWLPTEWSTYEPFVEFTFPGEGRHRLVAQFRDLAGNQLSFTETVTVDWTPPSTTATGFPADATQGETIVTLDATDTLSPISSVRYSIDGSAAVTYSGPFHVSEEGTHTLGWSALDAAGNREATKTTEFMVYASFPVEMQLAGGRAVVANPVVSVESSTNGAAEMCVDTGFGFGPWFAYQPVADVSLPIEGGNTVKVRYRSAKGTVIERRADVLVDLTAPAVSRLTAVPTHLRSVAGVWQYGVSFSWSAADLVSGVDRHQWRIGQARGVSSEPSVSVSVPVGAASFVADTVDVAGNRARLRRGIVTGFGLRPSVPTIAADGAPTRIVGRVSGTGRALFVVHGFRLAGDGTWQREKSVVGRSAKTRLGAQVVARPALTAGSWRFVLETRTGTSSTFSPPSAVVTVQ